MTNQPRIPRPTIDPEAVLTHLHAARSRPTPAAVWTAIADVPALLAEIERLADLLSRTRWDFADLLAAAQATIAADYDGEAEPLSYLRDAITEHRPWPMPDDGQPDA
ncbi:hypothetical protein KOI35_26595 [Actinoplanes bogorensis]|uniref:Uncharacterized protein n=1 Tax=Paractinoplanes bogorensis TaxID=1610840 RepID=A0ABS5YUR2_9ACTN|nr:hypothetical protein [Actinoplanes bogorensis]MBU2667081.1 hypothetical protein [Actinoplanes bogorensis]